MPEHDPMVRILHMRDYSQKALTIVEGKRREDLDKDEKPALALTHLVEIIGEAANQVPQDIKSKYSEIPWPKVVGIRNRLIHGYESVDYDILWDTVNYNLPDLISALNRILTKET